MKTTKKIVFIDDDQNWGYIVKNLSSLLGFSALKAGNTEDCLKIIRNDEDVRMLLTDIRMPDGSGFDLITKAREIKPDMPVVIITGYETEKLSSFISENKIDGLLIKPFSVREFDQKIRKALDLLC